MLLLFPHFSSLCRLAFLLVYQQRRRNGGKAENRFFKLQFGEICVYGVESNSSFSALVFSPKWLWSDDEGEKLSLPSAMVNTALESTRREQPKKNRRRRRRVSE